MEKIPQPEQFAEKKDAASLLEKAVFEISKEVNGYMKETFGIEKFVGDDGKIDMQEYVKRNPHLKGELNKDEKEVARLEKIYSRESDFYENNHQSEIIKTISEDELVEIWKKENRENIGHQFELLVMKLFHKFYSEDFVVAHSAPIDDYCGYIDTVLINKKTGAIVCAFDEVIGYPSAKSVSRKDDKIEKMYKDEGGAILKYGFDILEKDGKLKYREREIHNLPIFRISIDKKNFYELFEAVIESPSDHFSDIERRIMDDMLKQLNQQSLNLKSRKALQSETFLQENIQKSEESFRQMKEKLENLIFRQSF